MCFIKILYFITNFMNRLHAFEFYAEDSIKRENGLVFCVRKICTLFRHIPWSKQQKSTILRNSAFCFILHLKFKSSRKTLQQIHPNITFVVRQSRTDIWIVLYLSKLTYLRFCSWVLASLKIKINCSFYGSTYILRS